jgi:hypothetical protein
MVSRIVRTSALAAVIALSGAAYAQTSSPGANDPADQRGPVATDPSENGPPSANPTDRGGGPGGPAIKRSQERDQVPAPRPRRQMDE